MELKGDGKMNIKKSFASKSFRYGSVSFITAAVVVVIAVVFNMAILALPSEYTKIDVSSSKLYALSDEAKKIISGYSDDIEIKYIVEDGKEDAVINELLERAMTANPHITVTHIDPVKNPELTSDYSAYSQNSFVVISDKREKVVSYADVYQSKFYLDGTEISSSDYQQYMAYAQLGMYTGNPPTTERIYCGESLLASALDYVTTDNIPIVYYLTGHGELEIDKTFSDGISKDNIELKPLQLATSDAVPENASAVLINIPSGDISKEEYEKLSSYVKGGGNIMLHSYYKYSETPNLFALMSDFGMEAAEGIVFEGDSNMYSQAPYNLYPKINTNAFTAQISGKYIFAPTSHGIKQSDTLPEGVTVTSLLETSDDSYLKSPQSITEDNVEKSDGDVDGPFMIGAAAQYSADGTTGNVLWFSSPFLAISSYDYNGAVLELYLSAVNTFCNKDAQASVALASKTISDSILTTSSRDNALIGTIIILIIPIGCIAIGLANWNKRRKK